MTKPYVGVLMVLPTVSVYLFRHRYNRVVPTARKGLCYQDKSNSRPNFELTIDISLTFDYLLTYAVNSKVT